MINDALISVIIPVYKTEPYLERCVESVRNQTYSNLEIILVDDGSPDNCPEICDEYAKKDSRIRVIHKKNGGVADARNAGLDLAEGEYIGFVDSDDFIDPKMYELLYGAIVESGLENSVCEYISVNEDGEQIDSTTKKRLFKGVFSARNVYEKQLFESGGEIWTVVWNKLFHKRLFDNIRFPAGRLFEDNYVMHDLLFCAENVSCITDNLYYYVQRSDSITGKSYSIRSLDDVDAVIARLECFIAHGLGKESLYRNYNTALFYLSKSYNHFSFSNKQYRQRYCEIHSNLNRLSKQLLKCNFSFSRKVRMLICLISPRLLHKVDKGLRVFYLKKHRQC